MKNKADKKKQLGCLIEKQLTAVVLIFFLSVSMFCPVKKAAAMDENKAAYAMGLLAKLNLVDSEEIVASDNISKGDFIELLVKTPGLGEATSAARQLFFDVPLSGRYADSVNIAFENGIINGNSDGRLGVDKPLTVSEAIAMLVRALGSEEIAMSKGGYPGGYISFALNYDLLDGVEQRDGTLTYGEACILLYNMLNAGTLKTNDGKQFYFDTDDTILKSYYHIEKISGIVDKTHRASLYGDVVLQKRKISINEVVYDTDNNIYSNYLGYHVEAFINTEDTTGKIVYMYPYRNKEIYINSEQVEYYRPGELTYIDKNNKRISENISNKAVTLVNDVRKNVTQQGIKIPEHSFIRLIDNDNDNVFDAVLIVSVAICCVDEVAGNGMKIYTNSSLFRKINFEDYDEYIIMDTDGNSLSPEEITNDSVINVCAKEDKSLIEIEVYNRRKNVYVYGISEEKINDSMYYDITGKDGENIRTICAFGLISDKNTLSVGNSYETAINRNGEIVAVIKEEKHNDWHIGYLSKWGNYGKSISNNFALKIFNEQGIFEEIFAASKVKINGSSGKNESELKDKCKLSIVKFRTNENNELTAIEFPAAAGSGQDFRVSGHTDNSRNSSTRFYTATNLIGGQIAVDSNTKVFIVPDDGDENHFDVAGASVLQNKKYYPNSVGYITDKESIYSEILVISSVDESITRDSEKMLITSITDAFDSRNDEYRKKVTGFINGAEKSYFTAENLQLIYAKEPENTIPISVGDAVRLSIDSEGDISNIKLDFDQSEMIAYDVEYANENDVDFGADLSCNYGTIYDKNGLYFTFVPFKTDAVCKYMYAVTSATHIYKFDSTKSLKDKTRFEIVSITEAESLTENPETEEKIFFMQTEASVPFIVIYRKGV